MSVETIGAGTRQLAEWAVREMFLCEVCNGKRSYTRLTFGEEMCQEDCRCLPWLRAALDNPTDAEWWGKFGDHLEDQGDPRAADCRMIARLLPLDVWPDEDSSIADEEEINGWWDVQGGRPVASDIRRLGIDWIATGLAGSFPSILEALRALDRALQERA